VGIDPSVLGYVTKEEEHKDKGFIIKEGSHGAWIYVILQGKVKVKKTSPRGMVVLATLTEGEVFGELVLWEHGELARTASVVAEGPVRVGILDTEQLRKDYEAIPPRLRALIKTMMTRLIETTEKAVALAGEVEDSS
jgi:CRP-like cAMP-binding protein